MRIPPKPSPKPRGQQREHFSYADTTMAKASQVPNLRGDALHTQTAISALAESRSATVSRGAGNDGTGGCRPAEHSERPRPPRTA